MPLQRTVADQGQTGRGQGTQHRHDDHAALQEAIRPVAEDREPIFDIGDFAAIARFAGIAPALRRAGQSGSP